MSTKIERSINSVDSTVRLLPFQRNQDTFPSGKRLIREAVRNRHQS